jgi:hypothetical protein
MLTFGDNLPSGGDNGVVPVASFLRKTREDGRARRGTSIARKLRGSSRKGRHMTRRWVAAVVVLALPGVAAAEEEYRHGRIRHVEDGVSIQRAAEPVAEEAEPNVPFLPGDRVWTDDRGRVEFQFDAGAFLRLDNGTKLDYLDNPGGRVVLRLWSGGLYIHQGGRDIDFEIETPGGVVSTRGRGVYRIDAHSGETRVSVYQGEAAIEGGRGARIREGERVFARDGEVIQGPMAFDARDADDFAMWADERLDSVRYAQERRRPADLPQEAAPYYDELFDHGSWSSESVGFVWRPRVAVGWQPYTHGRWIWTAYGWTWLGNEPWAWAPFHYGRWGYSPAGWYWSPSRGWGPGWVSWAVGGPYVGWCPLGIGNRPVVAYDRRYRGGQAVPRAGWGSWVYARHGDMTARDLSRRRVQVDPAEMQQIRMLASRTRLNRDLRVVEGPLARTGGAVRNVRTTPAIGDAAPELRTGNQTAIPFPVARRRTDGEPRHDRGNSFGGAAGPATQAAPRAPDTGTQQAAPADRERPAATARTFSGADSGRARHRRPEAPSEPAPVAATGAAPVARSRPRASDEAGAARPRSEDGAGTPRQYRAAPRERAQDDGGQGRAAPADRGDSGGGPRPRAERAPRQESAPPAAQSAPAARESAPASARARRRQD